MGINKKGLLIIFVLINTIFLGCATTQEETGGEVTYKPAVAIGNKPVKKEVIKKYVPVPMAGQLMKLNNTTLKKSKNKKLTGKAAVKNAAKKATKQPQENRYINSIMTFDYMDGALYQIYCAPLQVTDIELALHEKIVSIAAGDTLRWQVSKTYSGEGASIQEHIIIKPTDSGLTNNMVITTNQRTYYMVLRSTDDAYMTSVKWQYPKGDGIVQTFAQNSPSAPDTNANVNIPALNLSKLNFNYSIIPVDGRPKWMPTMVFNDGIKTYIQFSPDLQSLPTLFIADENGDSQVVNYRVRGNYYIVDQIFKTARLVMGQTDKRSVEITFDDY